MSESVNRYKGRRFAGMLISSGLVAAGYFVGPVEAFSSYSTTIGLLYTVYLGGQSATDWKNGTVKPQ